MSKAKPENKSLPKRFYAAAMVQQNDGAFCLALDGKLLRSKQGNLLQHSSQQLVQQMADEWNAQNEVIDSEAMPLTRLLNIALDRVQSDRNALLADIANYCETDLLFYHAPREGGRIQDSGLAQPLTVRIANAEDKLALLQQQHFTPLLKWASATHGLDFNLTDGVMPIAQPAQSLQTMAVLFSEASDYELAALAMMVPLLGSALLVLAVWQGAITAEAALAAAALDEQAQAEQWGEDAETDAKWASKARDVKAAAFFLTHNRL